MRSVVEQTGRPLSMTVQQPEQVPDRWREMAAWVAAGVADGLPMRTQVAPRPIGVLQGLQASVNPVAICPSFREIAGRPLADQVEALVDPSRRERIIEEHRQVTSGFDGLASSIFTGFDRLFPMSDPVDYEPDPSQSVAARAAQRGVDPVEVTLDLMVEHEGRQLLYMTLFNYANGNLDDVREMLLSPNSVIGLSDAGAHCGAICDGSFPTTALALWSRRPQGSLPVELMVHHLTQRTARQVGWHDRGVLAPGHLGDVNLIDLDRLAAHRPHIVRDLPAGGRRLVQSASGYVQTIKRGVVTFRDGEATGDQPGHLVRGPQRRCLMASLARRLRSRPGPGKAGLTTTPTANERSGTVSQVVAAACGRWRGLRRPGSAAPSIPADRTRRSAIRQPSAARTHRSWYSPHSTRSGRSLTYRCHART